ncbi:unnamed protein product [Rotaria socialis]|uniref:AIG1-type G domain-containing protein n=1 Tax=Rotaria socialis TaxID=392032 RepID=A0A818JN49_9BILA|nr:unnamed protein product [Rotaria socialis]CAF3505534.1 unnamed protein product [Rotaria socialis]CAF3510326.1 unnamed protein product [Rotaria socialis]CAF3541353.1 unnamed protein product [Rotaria socialis]CAF4372906.1 unnamed protein product [Rotaria socialis]
MVLTRSKRDVEQRQQEILDALNDYYKTLNWPSQSSSIHKYILLLGRTRAGKTTLKHMLEDPRYIDNDMGLISKTRETDVKMFDISQSNLRLTLVDTPALIDRHMYTDETLSINESFNRINSTCLNKDIKELHLVCFCISLESGINDRDLELIRQLLDHFGPELAEHLCMIITRCEFKNDEQRLKLQDEIENDTAFKLICKQFKKDIYFSGALRCDDWNQGSDAILIQFKNVCNYRQKFIGLFQQSNTTYKLKLDDVRPANETDSNKSFWRCKFRFVPSFFNNTTSEDLLPFVFFNNV